MNPDAIARNTLEHGPYLFGNAAAWDVLLRRDDLKARQLELTKTVFSDRLNGTRSNTLALARLSYPITDHRSRATRDCIQWLSAINLA